MQTRMLNMQKINIFSYIPIFSLNFGFQMIENNFLENFYIAKSFIQYQLITLEHMCRTANRFLSTLIAVLFKIKIRL